MLIVLALIFASFVAIFALQNAQTVPIRIFAWERETSVAVIVLATAAVGALSAVLAGLVRQLRSGIRFRQLRSELAKAHRLLEEERARANELQSRVDELEAGNDASPADHRAPAEADAGAGPAAGAGGALPSSAPEGKARAQGAEGSPAHQDEEAETAPSSAEHDPAR